MTVRLTNAIICEGCGKVAPRRGHGHQKYCLDCSADKSRQRKREWGRSNPAPPRSLSARHQDVERTNEAGGNISRSEIRGFGWVENVTLAWYEQFWVPFSYKASKNAIFALSGHHVSIRREARSYRQAIAVEARRIAMRRKVATSKVWIDILVQKPNHRGDAINVVDLVCDGIKDGLGVDDRWFSIRRLDWDVVKIDLPKIFIGIGQEYEAVESCVCSSCGRVLPLASFPRNRSSANGVSRNCRECRTGRVKAWPLTEEDVES